MTTKTSTHGWEAPLAWSAFWRTCRLFVVGFVGWLWFLSSDSSALRTISLIAVLVLAALAGITWYLAAARADRRWRAALDRYADNETAKQNSRRERLARGGGRT